ncbi:hypothetical protein GCM10010912_66800 [Paenibacillus albidus]|uniref:Aminoglycoside adenylyltransferase n=2 Tax=Paenibacillus albidus TaxID=2041023 RepID=A0A917D4V7_9BACL|nr:hypothetical protein GCM10010912_66800 [Paenibacillus albidus]
MALGRVTREHEDLDLCIYREDAAEALQYFQEWDIKVAVPGENRLVDYEKDSDLALPRYCLHLFRDKDFVEILLTEREGDEILFRKNKQITLPANDFALRDGEGRPYVNPVWQLLFKSLNPREKDHKDFFNSLPCLNDQQKLWLTSGIRTMKPDSEWLVELAD